jgi:hypothetical protein
MLLPKFVIRVGLRGYGRVGGGIDVGAAAQHAPSGEADCACFKVILESGGGTCY